MEKLTSRFLTTISHELRTPLTSIIGYAKTLHNHGLGLRIVRTLVESHGGRGEVRCGSTGTHIAIKLPRTGAAASVER